MGTEAVGAYLWALRKALRKSRDALAAHFETSRSQIERVEFGDKGEVSPSLLLGITRYVGGDANVVAELLLDPNVTAEEARAKAAKLLNERQTQQLHEAAVSLTPEQLRAVMERLSFLERQVRVLIEDRESPGPLE